MEEKKLDIWLAEKVMGWHIVLLDRNVVPWYQKAEGIYFMKTYDWQPTKNIEQAFMLIEKNNIVMALDRDSVGDYECCILTNNEEYVHSGFYKSPSMAICQAIYKLVENK